ncbi:MAG TPA: ParB/RepB/Spo0J family partition protein [Candidatus Marinimicrobia bacterium]|nr:ParB/RepB/Spo0J family partition protein [Candidatus Neomarinimicrobiota bacterium]
MMRKKALGRGINAIIPEAPATEGNSDSKGFEVELHRVAVNPFQPRRDFREEELMELADSIREHGIIQPLTVRRKGDDFELVAGERRLRAARFLNLATVPVYLIETESDESLMELALIENLQREDLNAVEEAQAYKLLIERFQLSQEDVAKRVGKNRSTVTNMLRLLKLPDEILNSLSKQDEPFSAGHARALLALESPEKMRSLWQRVLSAKLSVRETEELVRKLTATETAEKKSAGRKPRSPYQRQIEDRLQNTLGTKVRLKPKAKGGAVEIEYYSLEDLERLMEIFDTIKL